MARTPDLLLINPASRARAYQALGAELAAVENPVWAGLLAESCRRAGLSVAVLDAEAEGLGAEETASRARDADPLLTAVVVYGHQPSASTQTMTAAGQVCSALKRERPEGKVILLGGHPAALPERTLREEEADFVAAGEGRFTLLGLVEALRGTAVTDADLARVPGLWRREDGRALVSPDRPLAADLGAVMPGQAWDLLPMARYRAHNWHCLGRDRQPYAALYTTLGCPYRCSFCCIQAPFRSGERAAGVRASTNSYRYWSPEAVLAQIDELVQRYGVRNLKVADEMFVLNRRHVLAICEGLARRRYDLNIWAYARVDTVREGLLDPLREAGFTWLALGIESGAAGVRAEVDKAFDQDQAFEVVGRIRAAGISVIGNYIFGLPEDDHDTLRATFDLATELECEFANFYSAMAYPGSPLYDVAVRHGVPLPAAWSGYAQHARDCLPLPTRHLTAREVLAFRDEAFTRYYTNPHYLGALQRRFGGEVVEAMRRMTAVRLERDLLNGTMTASEARLPHDEVGTRLSLV